MKKVLSLILCLILVMSVFAFAHADEKEKLVIWSHWADEVNKKAWIQTVVDNFLAKNPDFDVEINWMQKSDLTIALNAALPAGEGPDIFYLEPVITGAFPNFFDSGYMLDLTPYLDGCISDGAKEFAIRDDQIYLLPVEAYTPLMYINKGIFEAAGLPTDQLAFDSADFYDALGKIKDS